MSKIEKLEDIETLIIHWSENGYINNVLDKGGDGDIEKEVDVNEFDTLVKKAVTFIDGGYDKTSISVKLKSGLQWCENSKVYIQSSTTDLLQLLNAGQ